MSDEPMLERVAKTLEPQAWAALGAGDTLAYKNRRTSSLRKARSAIEAMREPTIAMKMAIPKQETVLEHYYGSGHHKHQPTLGSGPLPAYTAMLDAALEGK